VTISSLDHIIEASTVLPPTLLKMFASTGYQVGRAFSSWPMAGVPGIGHQDTTINGAILSGIVDGAPIIPNAPGGQKNYIGSCSILQTHNGSTLIADRLWSNQVNRASVSSQSIVTPTWPARDKNGSTNGEGVFIGLEISAQIGGGAGTGNFTLGYTDSDGNAGKTAVSIIGLAGSQGLGTAVFFPWGAGEKGVRSIQSIQLSQTWSSGVINLFAYRTILEVPTGPAQTATDLKYQETGLPEIPIDAVLFALCSGCTTGSGIFSGSMQVLQR
jgi:hypothetical protein